MKDREYSFEGSAYSEEENEIDYKSVTVKCPGGLYILSSHTASFFNIIMTEMH